jgi:dTDP-4-dehydrorhamnose reductase
MRVVVTGRAGQLVTSLVERGGTEPGLVIVPIGRPELDLETPGAAERAIAAANPDVVINAAAYTAVDLAEDEPERALRVNGEAAGEIASAARRAGAPVIQISTDYVFDGRSESPYREDAATNPVGAYGRSKLLGEERVRSANPDHVIVRTAWVYGPFGKNFLKTMMTAAKVRDELSVVADQHGNPSSSIDIADGLLALLRRWRAGDRRGLGQTYHLAGTGATSWFDFAGFIFEECARTGRPSAKVKPIKTEDWPTKAVRPANSMLDSTKFQTDFGYRMPDWQQSTANVVRDPRTSQ